MNLDPYPTWSSELEAIPDGSVVRPGDTLILRINPDRHVSRAEAEAIKEQAKAYLPDIDLVVVIADGFAIYRPDTPTTPKAESS